MNCVASRSRRLYRVGQQGRRHRSHVRAMDQIAHGVEGKMEIVDTGLGYPRRRFSDRQASHDGPRPTTMCSSRRLDATPWPTYSSPQTTATTILRSLLQQLQDARRTPASTTRMGGSEWRSVRTTLCTFTPLTISLAILCTLLYRT